MMTNRWVTIGLAVIMWLLASFGSPAPGNAAVILEAPREVARGDAFLARAVADVPLEKMAFNWRGKTYLTKTISTPRGYVAEMLLPAPLDEQSASLKLGAGAPGGNGSNGLADVSADIRLFDRDRPVQKLTVDKKYVDPPAAEKERILRDREKVRAALSQTLPEKLWTLPLQRPVPGSVSSLFGMKRVFNGQPRSVHRGLDLRGATGTPIKACADGVVVLVDNLYFSGNTVYLNHGDGLFSAYLHMSEPKVVPGQKVARGDIIGLVGATGRVTGPHLHLSMLVQGQSVDPQPLLEPLPPAKKSQSAREGRHHGQKK